MSKEKLGNKYIDVTESDQPHQDGTNRVFDKAIELLHIMMPGGG
jgi:hypothetical protein